MSDERVPGRVHSHLIEFFEFVPKSQAESACGEALLTATYLDELLRRILLAFMVAERNCAELLEGSNGPIATFSARIKACRAFSLFSKVEVGEPGRIRRIRNRFSHEIEVSFDDQRIKYWCRNFAFHSHGIRLQGEKMPTIWARGQFAGATPYLILNLVDRPRHVERERRAARDWPRTKVGISANLWPR